jgi:Icc-related predicted phosphoesterase
VIRVAAVADLHAGVDSRGTIRAHLGALSERADVLLLGGDLTRAGLPEEAAVLAEELEGLGVHVVAVLGNHDYHHDAQKEITDMLSGVGVRVLEGDGVQLEIDGARVGIAGVKGFGGGFAGACGTEFGEPEMKAFMAHTRNVAESLREALDALHAELRIALLHYAPVKGTLMGEKLEIYPFLGSYLLGEAVDQSGADLVLHGHAHAGSEKGVTPGGIHVRNVAQPVIKKAYSLYCFRSGEDFGCEPEAMAG